MEGINFTSSGPPTFGLCAPTELQPISAAARTVPPRNLPFIVLPPYQLLQLEGLREKSVDAWCSGPRWGKSPREGSYGDHRANWIESKGSSQHMSSTRKIFFGILTASLVFGPLAAGQAVTRAAPTAADWAALAKRPD